MEQPIIPVKRIVISAGIGFVITLLLLLCLTALVSFEVVSPELARWLVYACVFLGGFLASFFVKTPSKKLYSAVMMVGVLFLLLLLAGFLLPFQFSVKNSIYILIILLLSAIINSVMTSIK